MLVDLMKINAEQIIVALFISAFCINNNRYGFDTFLKLHFKCLFPCFIPIVGKVFALVSFFFCYPRSLRCVNFCPFAVGRSNKWWWTFLWGSTVRFTSLNHWLGIRVEKSVKLCAFLRIPFAMANVRWIYYSTFEFCSCILLIDY